MLQAFLDESELRGMGIYAVAGYLFDEEGSDQFVAAWTEALADMGLAGFRFHMNDFENRRGQFEDWPQDVRIARLQRLHKSNPVKKRLITIPTLPSKTPAT